MIDTLRSCFVAGEDFNELDANSMARLLGRLRKVADGTGWGLLILHHTTKKRTSFYGSVAIGGAIDFLLTMINNEKAKTSTLSVRGRVDAVEDMTFRFDLGRQRLGLEDAVPRKANDEQTAEALRFLSYFGWDEEEAIATVQLGELIGKAGWG